MGKRKIKFSEDMLIRALSEKNEIGARALYDMYSASLFGVISGIVTETALAEDILQEAFIKIWNNFGQYQPERGRLFTWMVNLARNLAIDTVRGKAYRQTALHVDLQEAGTELAATETAYSPLEYRMTQAAVGLLQPRQRQVLELIYFKGYKHVEVAEALQMPLGSVKTCCRAGILQLRAFYAGDIRQLHLAS